MAARRTTWNELCFYDLDAPLLNRKLCLPVRSAPAIVYNDQVGQSPNELAICLAQRHALEVLTRVYQTYRASHTLRDGQICKSLKKSKI